MVFRADTDVSILHYDVLIHSHIKTNIVKSRTVVIKPPGMAQAQNIIHEAAERHCNHLSGQKLDQRLIFRNTCLSIRVKSNQINWHITVYKSCVQGGICIKLVVYKGKNLHRYVSLFNTTASVVCFFVCLLC